LEIAANKTHTCEQNRNSAPSPETQASTYGTQMAKYFTMNQPPTVAIDSAVSVVRPQLAITRLIARSDIPERTASIPSEGAYVVSVHLNHANSREWELWTDGKYTKTGHGQWAESQCAIWSHVAYMSHAKETAKLVEEAATSEHRQVLANRSLRCK
jgi:hypothetical protein